MAMGERLQLLAMVAGFVLVAPLALVGSEDCKPYGFGVGFLQLYWPKVVAHAIVVLAVLTHRFCFWRG